MMFMNDRASRRSKGRRARETGQAIVEFAVVATAFIMFVFGILDCARLFESWTAVQHAAREGARLAVTGQTSCTINGTAYNVSTPNRPDCIEKTVKNSTTGLLGGGISGSDVTIQCQSWTYGSNYATGTGLGTCQDTTKGSAGFDGAQCDAVEVTVTYNHKFMTFPLSVLKPSGVPLVGRQRMIDEPFGICS
jgi:Flp pilus assembly protein TadG